MKFSRTSGTPILLFALACAPFGWSQATINESQETAHLYVDVASGSDSNPGTAAKPFKTIDKGIKTALSNNQSNVGTSVTINPGIYREALSLSNWHSTSKPITIQAAKPGTVVVSGADAWTGWKSWSGHNGVYTHAWTNRWGLCSRGSGPFEQDITLRREMIFVNGTMLTQVLALGQLSGGTFYADEAHGAVYVQPAAGTNMTTADVEVPTRDALFVSASGANFVLRGITFAEANNCRSSSAAVMFNGGSNVLLDKDQFNWNNAVGVQMSGVSHYTVQNSIANHNGEIGFGALQSKYGLWTANEADYNNWRGSQGGIYGWNGGGFHFFQQHSNTLNGITILFNETHGVHWDTDTENVSASGIVSANNLRNGLFVEKDQGPLTISNSKICNNSLLNLVYDGGVALRASTYVTITGSVVANNLDGQIPVVGIGNAPLQVTNYETNQTYSLQTENLTVSSSTIMGGSSQQLLSNGNQGKTTWDQFRSTLGSDYNTWWNGTVTKPFTVPIPYQSTAVDWKGWLSATGRDAHSSFAKPSSYSCPSSADAQDFWFVNNNTGVLAVRHGNRGVYTLSLIPLGGFSGSATFGQFGVSSVPGASGSWSAGSLKGSGSVTFTVNTTSNTPRGTYPLTFSAQSGDVTRTVTVSLIVQ